MVNIFSAIAIIHAYIISQFSLNVPNVADRHSMDKMGDWRKFVRVCMPPGSKTKQALIKQRPGRRRKKHKRAALLTNETD